MLSCEGDSVFINGDANGSSRPFGLCWKSHRLPRATSGCNARCNVTSTARGRLVQGLSPSCLAITDVYITYGTRISNISKSLNRLASCRSTSGRNAILHYASLQLLAGSTPKQGCECTHGSPAAMCSGAKACFVIVASSASSSSLEVSTWSKKVSPFSCTGANIIANRHQFEQTGDMYPVMFRFHRPGSPKPILQLI
jgi:hypothetical protein